MRYLLLIVLIVPIVCFSQTKLKKKFAQKYNLGMQYFKSGDFGSAIEQFKKVEKKYPDYSDNLMFLATSYRSLKNYDEALKYYEFAQEAKPEIRTNIDFEIGGMAFDFGKYAIATAIFKKLLSKTKNDIKLSTKAKKWYAQSIFADKAVKNPVKFNPVNLGININSKDLEYFPSLSADEETMVFTRRENLSIANEDFYYSAIKEEDWNKAFPLEALNTSNNEGAQSITYDGKKVFFSAKDRRNGYGNFDIWMTEFKSGKWTTPKNLGANINTKNWESQPSISADGKTLIFTSVRNEGIGGYDLYSSTFEDGKWTKAKNLGKGINTKKNDQSPFLHQDGETLYFNSNGHIGLGKADLYMAHKKEDGNWSIPKNLGYPINTKDEELSLVVAARGNYAYFSSDREDGYGALDIYKFELDEKIKPKPLSYLKCVVKDAISKKRINAEILLATTDNPEKEINVLAKAKDKSSMTLIKADKDYICNITKKGYLFYSDFFSVEENPDGEPYILEIFLQPIEEEPIVKEDPVTTDPDVVVPEIGEAVVLNNIFFESGSAELMSASVVELNTLYNLLQDNPQIKIRINGHTDSVGTEDDNLILSDDRAKSVVDYLLSKGAAPNRLSYLGFGEAIPIASNNSPEGRKLNRRTEFEIIE